MNVRHDSSAGNDAVLKNLVQFLVVFNGKLNISWNDSLFLVVARCIASKLEKLRDEVFEHRGHEDRRPRTDSRAIAALFQITLHSADWEGETCPRASGDVFVAHRTPFGFSPM